MDSSQCVPEILPRNRVWKTSRLLWLSQFATTQLRLSVKYYLPHGSSRVEGSDQILHTPFAVVFGNHAEFLSLRVVDDFFKPDDVAVVNSLEDFEFLLNAFVGSDVRGNLCLLQPIFVHDLNRVELAILRTLAQVDFRESPLAQLPHNLVLIELLPVVAFRVSSVVLFLELGSRSHHTFSDVVCFEFGRPLSVNFLIYLRTVASDSRRENTL